MVTAHLEFLIPAWDTALRLYPAEVAESWLRAQAGRVDIPASDLACRVVLGELAAATAMPQGDAEPDDAYCLRYVLTLLAEATDS
jgi:hypothetical protein